MKTRGAAVKPMTLEWVTISPTTCISIEPGAYVIGQKRGRPMVPVPIDRPISEYQIGPFRLQQLSRLLRSRDVNFGMSINLVGKEWAYLEDLARLRRLAGKERGVLLSGFFGESQFTSRQKQGVPEIGVAGHGAAPACLRIIRVSRRSSVLLAGEVQLPHQLFRPRGFEARKVMPVHPARLRQTLRSAGNMARRETLCRRGRVHQAVFATVNAGVILVARDQQAGLLLVCGVGQFDNSSPED